MHICIERDILASHTKGHNANNDNDDDDNDIEVAHSLGLVEEVRKAVEGTKESPHVCIYIYIYTYVYIYIYIYTA